MWCRIWVSGIPDRCRQLCEVWLCGVVPLCLWWLSNLWLFNIGMSRWWSVTTVKWGRPARKTSHLVMAHATARSSSSIIANQLFGSDKKRDPVWMRDHVLPVFCWRTKLRPWRLASVQRRVSLCWSKYDKIGADVSDFLTFAKAASNSSVQVYSFLVLRSGCNGASKVAMVGVFADSWFIRPMKDRRSVRFAGVGNSVIAWVIDRSIWYPFGDRINPAKSTVIWANIHFDQLRVIFFSAHRCRNFLTCETCSALFWSYIMTSSMTRRKPGSLMNASSYGCSALILMICHRVPGEIRIVLQKTFIAIWLHLAFVLVPQRCNEGTPPEADLWDQRNTNLIRNAISLLKGNTNLTKGEASQLHSDSEWDW